MKASEIAKRLEELPSLIESKEIDNLRRHKDIIDLKESISKYKLQFQLDVEKNAKELGLTNAEKRKSEVNRRLANSKTYKILLDELREKEPLLEIMMIHTKKLSREFRALESISRLL